MIDGNFEPPFALKHMLKDMLIAGRLALSYHLDLAVATAERDRLLEQEQRGYAEEDFSVIARKYFPETPLPTVEQDLELFEKPPPIEPAATISSMGEVAAAVHDVDVAPPPPQPDPQTQPATDQSDSMESTCALRPPTASETTKPATPPHDSVCPEGTPQA